MANDIDATFNRFWSAFPRHEAKKDALKAWMKLNPSPELEAQILAALEWQTLTEQWTKDDGQYIPLPASYLRGERWTDERRQTDRRQSAQGLSYECFHEPKCLSRWVCGSRQRRDRQVS